MKFRVISISLLLLLLVGLNGRSNFARNQDQVGEPPFTQYVPSNTSKQIWYVYDRFSDFANESITSGLILQEKVRAMGYQLNLTDNDSNLQVMYNNGTPMDLIIVDQYMQVYSSTYLSWNGLNDTIPIIATGFGGLKLYENLGLDVGWWASTQLISNIEFFNRTHSITTMPYRMNATFTAYTDNSEWEGVYKPWLDDPSQGVEFFAGGASDNTRVPMTYEDDRYFYWGLYQYAKWTKATEQLFHNVLNFLIGPGIVEVETGCPPVEQSIDLSKLEVSNGDTFTYVVDQYSGPNDGYLIASNNPNEIRITSGDEYTITITNDTPYNVYIDIYWIMYSVTSGNQTLDWYSSINDPFTTDFMVTDWNFMECRFKYQFIDFINSNDFSSFSITNLQDEFIVEWATVTQTDGSEDNFEYRYNKTDGVRLYRYENFLDGGGRTQLETRLKGYLLPSEQTTETTSNTTIYSTLPTSNTTTNSISQTSSSRRSSSTPETPSSKEDNSDGISPLPGFEFYLFLGTFVILYQLNRWNKSFR